MEIFYSKKDLSLPEVHVDETELCGITYQFNGTMDVKFVHNIGAVVFNGLVADEKLFCNLFAGKSLGQQAHDLLLSGGQGPVIGIRDLCFF